MNLSPATRPSGETGHDATDMTMEFYPSIERHRDAILQCLARRETPLFLAERANLVDRYQQLERSLERHWPRHVIGYSFKTNYLAARCGLFQQLGAWAEVVSEREYALARELGYPGRLIIFNGPLKLDTALQTAMDDGALINVNDEDELERIAQLASDRSEPLEIGLRVSSTLPRIGHSRFGFSLESSEAASAVDRIGSSRSLSLVALHTHLYGDMDDPAIYRIAAERVAQFAQRHVPDYQRTLRYLDMGGGFPAHSPQPKSRSVWDPQPIDAYIGAIADALAPYFREAQPVLVVEPGRYLTCDGILLVSRVVHVKQRNETQVVNCDASVCMVPLTHYCPQVIQVFTPDFIRPERADVMTIINGSTCRENDVLFEGPFPRVERGDYLVHFAAGAYNSSLTPDFIFASPQMELF